MLTAAAELGVHSTGTEAGLHLTPQSQSPPASYTETSVPSLSLGPPLPRAEYAPGDRASDPTVPRTLSGVEVTGEEIDEIFQLYAPSGHPPRSFMQLEQDFGQREVDVQKLSPSLVLERKCQELVARCSAAVLEIGVRTMSLEQERALDILLRTFENQVTDLETQISQGIDSNRDSTGGVVTAPIGLMERHEPVLFDDQFLADFEWALGDDGLYPPTEPYGPDTDRTPDAFRD
ncbi:hypothetical protein APSETT444_002977 [Aspergillus pseudonomiae]